MTEQQAIEIWQELDPLDAAVRRSHHLGALDPYEYDVVVEGDCLEAPQVIDVIRKASAKGLEVTVFAEGDRSLLCIDAAEPNPHAQHPSAPK